MDGLGESDRDRKDESEEEACYLGRVAVWGLPFSATLPSSSNDRSTARRGGTCVKAMGAKASTWRITDM